MGAFWCYCVTPVYEGRNIKYIVGFLILQKEKVSMTLDTFLKTLHDVIDTKISLDDWGLLLFKAAKCPNLVGPDGIKTWRRGSEGKVQGDGYKSTFFNVITKQMVFDENGCIEFLKNSTNATWKKLQINFTKIADTESEFYIDITTTDHDEFCLSLMNQFKQICRVPWKNKTKLVNDGTIDTTENESCTANEEDLIDVLNENGVTTGKPKKRSEIHEGEGNWHRIALVCVVDQKNSILLQQRSSKVDKYPDTWDLSVASHVLYKEDSINTALREMGKEIGLPVPNDIRIDNFRFITSFRKVHTFKYKSDTFIDKQYYDFFLYRVDNVPISELNYDEEAVSVLKWVNFGEIDSLKKQGKLFPRTEWLDVVDRVILRK
jgi:isopentenyldiphosphate isomerase